MGRIGRYDLLKTIGLGGMAQVYLARATGDGGFAKVLVLKVLQPEFASQPEVVHFLDETQLVARLDVMKALSYEPDERFSDCAALESALEAVANLAAPPASDKTIAGWIRTVLDAVTPRTVSALRSSS